MKKFLIILAAVAVLGAGNAEAFPRHGGGHFRPAAAHRIHRPVIVKHKHHHGGAALAVAGTIIGASVLANLLAPLQPVQKVQTYVPAPQPVTTSNCTTTINNGVTVQQCVTAGY